MSPDQLIATAQSQVDSEEPILAAGVFSMQDSVASLAKGSLAGAAVDPLDSNPVLSGIGSSAAMEMARHQHARSQGLTERMAVAVSAGHVHVLAMPAVGATPERELLRFDRERVEVTVTRLGLSKRLKLSDPEAVIELKLIGTTVGRGDKAKGKKAVLEALA